jgi:hypothetical protein
VIRIFDERIDGIRTERVEANPASQDPGDEVLFKKLQSRIEALEGELGDREDIREGEIQDLAIEQEIQGMCGEEEFEEYMFSRMKELNEEVEKRMEEIDGTNMSEEELKKKRSDLKDTVLAEYKDGEVICHHFSFSANIYDSPTLARRRRSKWACYYTSVIYTRRFPC